MNLTTKLLIVSIFFYAVYDVIIFAINGPEATLNQVILNDSRIHPVVPLAVGIILGHLFWPQH
jgi:hypothetical protein